MRDLDDQLVDAPPGTLPVTALVTPGLNEEAGSEVRIVLSARESEQEAAADPIVQVDSAETARGFTPRLFTCFRLANRETEALGDDHVGPEHLLLAVLKEGRGVGVEALNKLGVDAAELRRTVYAGIVEAPEASDPTAPSPTDEDREARLDMRRMMAEARMSPEDRVVFTSSEAARVFCVLDGLDRLFKEGNGQVTGEITKVIGQAFVDRAGGDASEFTPNQQRKILRSIVSGLRRSAADQVGE